MAAESYSIKDMADILGVSKQRVYRCIRANHIKEAHTDTVKGNSVLKYDKRVLEQIRELLEDSATISSEAYQKHSSDIVNDILYETLVEQLKIKDKQIEKLNERLAEANRNLDNAQKLHAMDKQRLLELESKQAEESLQDQEERKGFWSRLFSRW